MHLVQTRSIAPLFPRRTWRAGDERRALRLTFDDGPHPDSTPALLDVLCSHGVLATFFCVGQQIEAEPALYQRIIDEGHTIGNHSHKHLDGWQTSTDTYVADVQRCAEVCDSMLFRPPYGRLRRSQERALLAMGYEIVMWSIMPGDWAPHHCSEVCYDRIVSRYKSGDIVLLHDKGLDTAVKVVDRLLQHGDFAAGLLAS